MTRKTQTKLTDAERHRRFMETARELAATDETSRFDTLIRTVAVQKSGSKKD